MTPEEEKAFEEGRSAYRKGRSETANPYDVNSDLHLSWNDGWMMQCEEDDPEGGN